MEVLIDYTYGQEALAGFPVEDLARLVLETEEMPHNAEVSISFVDNTEIAELNREYRGIDGPTDVLSFECDLDDEDDEMFSEEDPVFQLGDIIIAPDVARAQTETFGTTFEQEMSLLLVHGLLHLCGYDHIEDEEALEMQAREKEILGTWFAGQGMSQELQENPVAYEPIVIAERVVKESAIPYGKA